MHLSVTSVYAQFGASCTKTDRGRRQKCKIRNECDLLRIGVCINGIHNRHNYIHYSWQNGRWPATLSHSLGYCDMLFHVWCRLVENWRRGFRTTKHNLFLSLRYDRDRKRCKNSDRTTLTQILTPLFYAPYASPYSCHVSQCSIQNWRGNSWTSKCALHLL